MSITSQSNSEAAPPRYSYCVRWRQRPGYPIERLRIYAENAECATAQAQREVLPDTAVIESVRRAR